MQTVKISILYKFVLISEQQTMKWFLGYKILHKIRYMIDFLPRFWYMQFKNLFTDFFIINNIYPYITKVSVKA
jgi:hypothetical protein